MYIPEAAIEFRVKYFSVFIVSTFLGVFSYVFALVLAMGTYFEHVDVSWALKLSFSALLIVSVLQTLFCFKILRGHPRWVGGMIFLFLSCLLFSAPTIIYDPDFRLYAGALSIPLMGLYCLNSERYRAMLQAAETVRVEKAAGPQLKLKASRRQTAINNRLRAKSEKPFVVSECSITLIKWLCWVLALFFIFVMGVKLYLVYGGLVSGVVVGANRYGPPKSYSLVGEPWRYGLSMILHLLAIGVCALFLKIMLLLRK